jgi:hypothetical protein
MKKITKFFCFSILYYIFTYQNKHYYYILYSYSEIFHQIFMNLSVVSNFYLYNIFPGSRVMSKIVSNKAKNEFIAFRKKYRYISNEFSW